MPVSRMLFVSVVSLSLLLVSNAPSPGQILNASQSQQQSATSSQPALAADTQEKSSGILPASWQMPKITLPKMSLPKMPSLWTSNEKSPSSKSSLFEPLASGTRKLSEGTKKTWAGTKQWFASRGQPKQASRNTRTRSRQQPSIWKRMFGPKPEPVGPQTVGEWMSQERIDH